MSQNFLNIFYNKFTINAVKNVFLTYFKKKKKSLFEIISSTLTEKTQIRCKLYYLLLDSQRTEHAQRSIPLHATPHVGPIKT